MKNLSAPMLKGNKILKFESFVLNLGGKRTVVLITAISITLSVLLTCSICLYFEYSNLWSSSLSRIDWILIVASAALVPLIVAPIVTGHLVRMVFRIHYLQEELQKLATLDSLTGLLNHGAMMNSIEKTYKLAIKEQQEITFIMMDIDYFKNINDRYGHAAGDMVLKNFGTLIKKISKSSDLVGRVGGEEFLACLYGDSSLEGHSFINRLQDEIRGTEYRSEGHPFKVTSSIGITKMSPLDPLPLDTLLKNVDKALYQAKRAGRNKVIEHTQGPPGQLQAS